MDAKFMNVLILGFGFMLLFSSFQTMGNIEVSQENRKDNKNIWGSTHVKEWTHKKIDVNKVKISFYLN